MKSLQEPIAVRANEEVEAHGHFFAARFGSLRLLDAEAMVACAIYVELNEARARLADFQEVGEGSAARPGLLVAAGG
jgi:hypothetical protein